MKNILIIHRWLGVVACLAVLMFAGSGILHPVMSRFQPQPAQFAAPSVDVPASSLSLRAALEKNQIDRFSAASLVQLPDVAVYRVQDQRGVHYFRVDDGHPVENGERIHAEFLARHFLGDKNSSIALIAEQKKFDDDYVFVNRLLPAWRIDFARDDGMRVYVDTAGNRLATLTDSNKRIFQVYFRALHDFDFLEEHNTLRLAIMLFLLFAAFATAVAGVVMYVRIGRAAQRLKNLPARRWHRRLSLAVAVVTFSFVISGGWHLLQSQVEFVAPENPHAEFLTSELGNAVTSQAFVLLRANDKVCYRQAAAVKRSAEHEHHHPDGVMHTSPAPACLDTETLQPIVDADQKVAEQLARYYSKHESAAENQREIESAELVTKFGGEYGFINKRLPVWKIQFKGDSTRWYVETASGALALRADDADAREGWVFSTFHKARFIQDPYKNLRDGFLMASAALMMIVSLLGLWLFVKRLRPVANTD
ncbi:MAG: PepSY domain-containing protein [Spongiibacteraceae bacterium]